MRYSVQLDISVINRKSKNENEGKPPQQLSAHIVVSTRFLYFGQNISFLVIKSQYNNRYLEFIVVCDLDVIPVNEY